MPESHSESAAPVEQLLEQRAQYEKWLLRLDTSGGTASETVRQRVRADYQLRLDGVVEQLKGHGSAITAELDRHRNRVHDLDGRRTAAEETLAEAEVRHTVGEFADTEWQRISGDMNATLERIVNQLSVEQLEVHRLEEVERVILAPAAVSAPPPVPPAGRGAAAPPPAAALAPAPPRNEPPPTFAPAPPMGAPRFVPRPGGAAPIPSPRTAPPPRAADAAPVDELAFLKSVTGEEGQPRGAAPRRSSETVARPVESAPPEPAAPEPEPVAAVPPPAPTPALTLGAAPAERSGAGAGYSAKTLKCGECGTLNRPTEWYCERCGAELAAL